MAELRSANPFYHQAFETGNGFLPATGFAAHTGRWNCLYSDGHVKAMKPTQTMNPVNQWGATGDNIATDGPGCDPTANPLDVNCDVAPSAAIADLALLEKKYQ